MSKSAPRRTQKKPSRAPQISKLVLERLAQRLLPKILTHSRTLKLQSPADRKLNQVFCEVSLISGPAMKKLNLKYRAKNSTTDVLSFATASPFRDQGNLGEVIICLPVLKRQAKARGLTESMELAVLLTHGVLHLLGYDHESSETEWQVMAQAEQRLLKKIVPPAWLKASAGRCTEGLIGRPISGKMTQWKSTKSATASRK